MRDEGLCKRCGKSNPTPEHCMCPECREKENERRRNNYQYYKKIKICTKCVKNRAEPNRTLCYECAEKRSDAYMRRGGRTDKQKQNKRIRNGELRKIYKESGLCSRCGKNPSIDGGLCKICRAHAKLYWNSHKEGLPRSEWRSYGICYNCGKNKR